MKKQFKNIVLIIIFLIANNINSQSNLKKEIFTINWPKEEGWHIVKKYNKATSNVTMLVFLKNNEIIENHSEIGTTYICSDSMNVSIQKKLEELLLPLKYAPTAKKTIIEKDEIAKYPWFILKIEHSSESQIWYVIKGTNELYCNFWSTKQNEIAPKSLKKWVKIFKSSKIVLK